VGSKSWVRAVGWERGTGTETDGLSEMVPYHVDFRLCRCVALALTCPTRWQPRVIVFSSVPCAMHWPGWRRTVGGLGSVWLGLRGMTTRTTKGVVRRRSFVPW
jgi:hypothetical protein